MASAIALLIVAGFASLATVSASGSESGLLRRTSASNQASAADDDRGQATDKAASRNRQRAAGGPNNATPPKSSTPPAGTAKDTSTGDCAAAPYQRERTANGEKFNPLEFTAEHRTLPFHTKVRVTAKTTGQSVIVRINDRGPEGPGQCLGLSPAAYRLIAPASTGATAIRYEILPGTEA